MLEGHDWFSRGKLRKLFGKRFALHQRESTHIDPTLSLILAYRYESPKLTEQLGLVFVHC